MKKLIKTTLFGGLVVIMPVVILVFLFRWLFLMVTDATQPLTNYMAKTYPVPELVADGMVIAIIVLSCFLVGLLVRMQAGKWLHRVFDDTLQRLAPGYRMVKEVVVQIFGNSESSPSLSAMESEREGR